MILANDSSDQDIKPSSKLSRKELYDDFKRVRSFSDVLTEPLLTEDYVIQTMTDVSPTKWHLAHTSWFFEAFVLSEIYKDYKSIDPKYTYLFNSYYVQVGERHCRPKRGLLSRPTVNEIYDYRNYVDHNMEKLFEELDDKIFEAIAPVIEIGIHHEQQHQELILTDIKHVFSENPLDPVYQKNNYKSFEINTIFNWIKFDEGIHYVGNNGDTFGFDNEFPYHKTLMQPFQIASRLTTNAEYIEFIEDG
ncbi:MAG: ergothioneine biosynthesis protein EgtB, partial [Candidatus Dadabacteria bacterium]|nr:ergothioneine biosynthesis protein EgtB [Candidatus Dadabacteria bacterium]NIQ16313.1 ergothioneine biosynthesis protein EgtB [Candidatus Dadabacteria bacterium]